MDNVQPMDGHDFLSLAVTAVVSYLVLFLLTKLVCNKQISQMTMFDYISGISVGSIAAEMATEPESPLRPLTGMVVYGDRKSTRQNSSHNTTSRMPSSA